MLWTECATANGTSASVQGAVVLAFPTPPALRASLEAWRAVHRDAVLAAVAAHSACHRESTQVVTADGDSVDTLLNLLEPPPSAQELQRWQQFTAESLKRRVVDDSSRPSYVPVGPGYAPDDGLDAEGVTGGGVGGGAGAGATAGGGLT